MQADPLAPQIMRVFILTLLVGILAFAKSNVGMSNTLENFLSIANDLQRTKVKSLYFEENKNRFKLKITIASFSLGTKQEKRVYDKISEKLVASKILENADIRKHIEKEKYFRMSDFIVTISQIDIQKRCKLPSEEGVISVNYDRGNITLDSKDIIEYKNWLPVYSITTSCVLDLP